MGKASNNFKSREGEKNPFAARSQQTVHNANYFMRNFAALKERRLQNREIRRKAGALEDTLVGAEPIIEMKSYGFQLSESMREQAKRISHEFDSQSAEGRENIRLVENKILRDVKILKGVTGALALGTAAAFVFGEKTVFLAGGIGTLLSVTVTVARAWSYWAAKRDLWGINAIANSSD